VSTGPELVAFFDFDDPTLTDRSARGHRLVLSADPPTYTSQGREMGAFRFDASRKNHVVVPLDINPSAMPQLTMGGWFKSLSGRGPLLSHDNGGFDRALDIDTRGGPGVRWSAFTGKRVFGGSIVIPGRWTFVAMRHDQPSGRLVLDVDGEQLVTSASYGPGAGRLQLGKHPGFAPHFDGLMDNVFVYKGILSDARIADIRARGRAAILPPTPAGAGGSAKGRR
jgi:hypothetical protein